MSFDNLNVTKRDDEELKRLREERKKRMFSTGITANTSEPVPPTQDDENAICYIPASMIDKNPDNEIVFNMNHIKEFSEDINEDGFIGSLVVTQKADGRYEIISGHRRFEALKMIGKENIPCQIYNIESESTKAKLMLRFNIDSREITNMDRARAIQYYIEKVQPFETYTGRSRDNVAEFFHISPAMVHRYMALVKVIPELQELADNPEFPFSALSSATALSVDEQKILHQTIVDFCELNENSLPSRDMIEKWIKRIKVEREAKSDTDKKPTKVSYADKSILKIKKQLTALKTDVKPIENIEETTKVLSDIEQLIVEIKNMIQTENGLS